MTKIARFLLAAAVLGLGSCALLTQGTTEEITVLSDPPGATVTLPNGETHLTPCTITVRRQQDIHLHFEKAGYESRDVDDNSLVEGGYILADALTLSYPIDAATGASYKHEHSTVVAHMDPQPATTSGAYSKATWSSQSTP
jgi:hypothetical protein